MGVGYVRKRKLEKEEMLVKPEIEKLLTGIEISIQVNPDGSGWGFAPDYLVIKVLLYQDKEGRYFVYQSSNAEKIIAYVNKDIVKSVKRIIEGAGEAIYQRDYKKYENGTGNFIEILYNKDEGFKMENGKITILRK